MKNQIIHIWKNKPEITLTTYISERKTRPAVLIFPGGGYGFVSPREAEPIALKFLAAGFQAFVLNYSVTPAKHPQMLFDAAKALEIIRVHAEDWFVKSNQIAVMGFSAGGHLAASLGVFWNKKALFENSEIDTNLIQPNALILSYPVITSGPLAHRGSFINLLGEQADETLVKEMALETQVTENTPPSFIWHTFADNAVPVENSLLFAQALRAHHVPFELHIYPNGSHGLSLADEETSDYPDQIIPHVAGWMKLCIEWLNSVFEVKS